MNKEILQKVVWKNLTIIIVLVLTLFGIQEHTAQKYAPHIETAIETIAQEKNPSLKATVVKVYDGDTLTLANGERVRLIGINAPEIGEPFATSSKNFLESLILDKEITLVSDITPRDRYNRILSYVYINDIFVNERMVEVGLAKSHPYKPDITLQGQIESAEVSARENELGLWSN